MTSHSRASEEAQRLRQGPAEGRAAQSPRPQRSLQAVEHGSLPRGQVPPPAKAPLQPCQEEWPGVRGQPQEVRSALGVCAPERELGGPLEGALVSDHSAEASSHIAFERAGRSSQLSSQFSASQQDTATSWLPAEPTPAGGSTANFPAGCSSAHRGRQSAAHRHSHFTL